MTDFELPNTAVDMNSWAVCAGAGSIIQGVTFETDSDRLTLSARQVLDVVVEELRAVPGESVQVLAYTDSRGSDAYNLALSVRRAVSVKEYLQQQGIGTGRLESKGLGEANPIADNNTAAGRERNRHVELVRDSEVCQ